jgi:hypothetical protein
MSTFHVPVQAPRVWGHSISSIDHQSYSISAFRRSIHYCVCEEQEDTREGGEEEEDGKEEEEHEGEEEEEEEGLLAPSRCFDFQVLPL